MSEGPSQAPPYIYTPDGAHGDLRRGSGLAECSQPARDRWALCSFLPGPGYSAAPRSRRRGHPESGRALELRIPERPSSRFSAHTSFPYMYGGLILRDAGLQGWGEGDLEPRLGRV
ncbi:hypothetical protein NDU88_005245 [Pleurodeles waltl]|uniref:Uncharacterized protein n=1 Tax=Pleurodeles waltl TaxID=8319 RepID=A0AAV7MXA3_PLEWA|nr:hypothetical protein NDU88_005245 [Pleurodeles waltl]